MVSEFQDLIIYFETARGWVAEGVAYNSTPEGHRVVALDFRGANAITIAAQGTVETLSPEVQMEIVQSILGTIVDAVIADRITRNA